MGGDASRRLTPVVGALSVALGIAGVCASACMYRVPWRAGWSTGCGLGLFDVSEDGPILEKHRHVLEHAGSRWEVDEFHGDNEGLVVAEIELEREDQTFARPSWLHTEVTHDTRYLNSNLSARPYRTW